MVRPPHRTTPGFGDPQRGTCDGPPLAEPTCSEATAASGDHSPLLIQTHHLTPEQSAQPPRRWLELHTRNTVYVVNARLECIEVRDASQGPPAGDHALLGAKLVGGHRRGNGAATMSYPIPENGSNAVFETIRAGKRRVVKTTAVERVVLHTHVAPLADGDAEPDWSGITGY